MLLTWGQCFSPADSKKTKQTKKSHCGDMIDLLFMFKFTLIKHIESISLFVLSHLCEYCLHYYRAQKRVTQQLLGREVTNGVFP